jgi:uncharacterized protein
MGRISYLRARGALEKISRVFATRRAHQLATASFLIALACLMPTGASAQLDAVLRNLMQNAMPGSQSAYPSYPPTYRPAYPPSYPSYPSQPTAPQYPGYPAYSAAPPTSSTTYPPSASRPAAPAVPDAAKIADMQRMLNDLGYEAGQADGELGSRTVQALRAFERDHGQPATAEISTASLAAVRSVWYEHNRAAAHGQVLENQSSAPPSFDCGHAAAPYERQICESPALAQLDSAVATAYAAAGAGVSPEDRAKVIAEQRAWLQRRNRCGADASCLEQSMTERLSQLQSTTAAGTMAGNTAAAGRDAPSSFIVPNAAPSFVAPSTAPAAIAMPAAIATDQLLHPPAGLRPLRLRIWNGLVLLNHPDSPDTPAFIDLVTLGIRPDLFDAPGPILDQVADYSRTFLNPKDPLNAQNWSIRNEFDKKDARAAFLRQYAEPLRQLAPRAPFRFAYATAVSLGRYDTKRHGFDLPGVGSYSSLQRTDPLQPGGIQLAYGRIGLTPRYDFDMPAEFWPIAEADARAMVESRFGPSDRSERRVQMITVLEATYAEPQTATLGLQIERLEIWDDALKTRLYSFDIAPLRHRPVSIASPLARLLHPPAGLRAWPLSSIDGRPAIGAYDVWRAGLQTSVLAQDLFRLVAAGSIPGYLEDSGNLQMARHFFSDQVIGEVFLGGASVDNRYGWAGSDEFARERTRQRFYSRYAPALRELAPRPPFDLVYTQDAMLGIYAAERRAFPVIQQDDSGNFLQRVRDGGLVPMPTYDPSSGLVWPLAPGRAETMLKTLPDRNVRKAKTAATYEIASLDPTTKRLVIKLKALSLYTPDLKTKLYDFPVGNDAQPYLTGGTPARLHVAGPAVLDDILICLKFIEAGGERVSEKIAETCWDRVAKRDEAFYAGADAAADLAPDDAHRPFFPRGGADRTPAAMAKFVEWAKTYAASLPPTVTSPPSGAITYGTNLVQPLATAGIPQREYYAKFLDEHHLQQDQLVSPNNSLYGDGETMPIIYVLPNRHSLYALAVPKEALDRHPGTGAQTVSTFRIGVARIIRNELKQNVLAIYLTPLSIKAFIKDDTLASRSFDDIPRLDGAAFTARSPQPSGSANSSPLSLDSALIDLVTTKVVGDRLSPQALTYIVTRRWRHENGEGSSPGGRFFAIGKRQPTPEEAASLAPSFVDWARTHGPALPVRVSISARVEIPNGQTSAPWRVLPCLGMIYYQGGAYQNGFRPVAGSELSDLSSRKSSAEQGSGSWSELDEQKLIAAKAAASAAEASFVGGVTGPCWIAPKYFSFPDPAAFVVRISHALPIPSVSALSGKQQFDLTATLEITSVALSQTPPSLLELLPSELAKTVPQVSGRTLSGEFASVDLDFIEARYRDVGGKEVARLGPDRGDSIGSVVKRFQQDQAKLLAAEATPKGPYGPDLVGVQLGMSFEDAERAIRKHMKVGRVLEGRRGFDEAEKSGLIKPMDSGKLFISEGEDELIAILDEPPAAKGRVLAAWRRVSIPAGSVDPTEIFAGVRKKYGKPGGRQNMQAGTIVSWYALAGSACSSLYAYGHADPLAEMWLEDGRPLTHAPANSVQIKAAPMPVLLFQPLAERSPVVSRCGPFVTVELLTASMLGRPRDELDMTLTDIGPYLKAYAESRRQLRAAASGDASSPAAPVYAGAYGPDMVGIKLGMTFEEAERVIRGHMKVGRVLETGKSGEGSAPGKSGNSNASGRLFISDDQSELIAILDEPLGAENTVVAAWRQIYEPPSATLEFVSGRLKEKYGQPASGTASGDTLLWGAAANPRRCATAYADALRSRSPIGAQWMENGAPTTWRPNNGDKDPSAPRLTELSPAGGQPSPVEDCGPWLTMQFFPAQGYPPLNVIETTLTDRARYEKARQAGLRALSPISSGSIKF